MCQIKNMRTLTCGVRRHRPPPWDRQAAPSAAELPLWGSGNPRLVLTEGTVSVHSPKRSQVPWFITDTSQEPGEGQSPVPGQQWAGDRERVAGTCYSQGGWGRRHWLFAGSAQSRNLWQELWSSCRRAHLGWVWAGLSCWQMPRGWLRMAVSSSHAQQV